MKKLLTISVLAILFYGSNGSAQNVRNTQNQDKPRIVSVVKEIFNIPIDFNIIPYCFDKNEIINDTLVVHLYTQNVTYPDYNIKDSFSFIKSVLNLYDYHKEVIDSTVTIDKKTGKRKVLYRRLLSVQMNDMNPHQKRTYKLIGFKEAPFVIQFNGKTLCHCPTKLYKFEIYKNDTINVIKANGRKEGVWLKFDDDGKVMKREEYNNGKYLGGYFYDKTGRKINENYLNMNIEQMPQFPGGEKAMSEFLQKNIKYPKNDLEIQGEVFVSFIVTKTGDIICAEIVRSLDPMFDKEALRVIKLMPKWIPAKRNGENVDASSFVRVNFKLP